MADKTETQPDRTPDGNSGPAHSAAPQTGAGTQPTAVGRSGRGEPPGAGTAGAGGPVQIPGGPVRIPGGPVQGPGVPGGPVGVAGAVADPPAAAGRTSNKTLGLRAITAGAVVTAVISSIINPDFLGKAWHALTGGDDDSTTTAKVVLETKSNERLSIVIKAPAGWGTGRAKVNLFDPKTLTPGDGMATGPNPQLGATAAVSRLYVAASHDGARRLALKTAADPDATLLAKLHTDDWTIDGCRLVGESGLPNETLVGRMREWSGCDGFTDSTMWQAWARTPDSGTVVYVQFTIRGADLGHDQALDVLRSVVIDPARLSG